VNLFFATIIVLVITGVAVSVMLFVRRTAPAGSYFNDGDRASGVFGVLATGFSVLLGFIVFLAFTSYDTARAGAESEAVLVAQQTETAQLLPPAAAQELTGELVCYARSVIGIEWAAMEDGELGEQVNAWGVELFETLRDIDPETPSQQAAYSKWLDQTSDREQARNDRIHGAVGVIPTPLWVVLFFISMLVFVYMLFFADSAERAIVQAVLMGVVVAVITSLLLLLQFLDDPFHPGVGALEPAAMERTEQSLAQELAIVGGDISIPCDEQGRPT
jgi:hypothetical protein